MRSTLFIILLLLTSLLTRADDMTFALKTSGTIDTSKKYLIVYQSGDDATSATLMSSSFTSAATSYARCAPPISTEAAISSQKITTDETNAFTFEGTGTDGTYYIKNNSGIYFGTSSSNQWFDISTSGIAHTVSYTGNNVNLICSYNSKKLCYATNAGGTEGNCGFFYGEKYSIYLYEEYTATPEDPTSYTRSNVEINTWESFCLPFNIDISTLQNNFDHIYIPYNGEDLVIYGDATSRRRLASRKAASASATRYTFAYSATGSTDYQFYLADFTSESGVVIPQGMPFFAHIKESGATDLADDGTLTLTGNLWDDESALTGQISTTFPVYSDAKLTTADDTNTFAVLGELSSSSTTPTGTLYALSTDGTFTVCTDAMAQYHAYLNTASAASIDLHPLPLSELSTQKAIDYDLNADGLVNIVDVAQLISILNGATDTYGNSDTNHDGTTDMDDLSLLIQKVLYPVNAEITIDTDPTEDTPVATDFNIQNEAVTDYINNTTVTLSSTADTNYGQSFFDTSRTYRPDQPATRTITFSNADASQVTITMATDKDYTNTVLTTTTTASTYTLRNFVPGKTYYYKVTDSNNSTLTSGALNATGQIRMIAIDKGFNIRDLGGWTGLNGNTVRYEALYRGGSLGGTDMYGTTSDITDDDRAELSRIGIRAQLDLRASTNSGKYASEESYHSYSRGETTLTGADFNNTMTDYGAYNQDASVVSDIAWIIYELKQGKPVYFNCRQGADRTGTIAFIIEGLLGCYGSDTGHQMAMDYELTGFSQANLVDNKTVDTSYRAATEAYGNTSKLFYALLNLTADTSTDSGVTLSNLQERCYYYLNRYWNARNESASDTAPATVLISKDDLDWFINYMLGITDLAGNLLDGKTKFTAPTWAQNYTTTLQIVAESKSTVVTYK